MFVVFRATESLIQMMDFGEPPEQRWIRTEERWEKTEPLNSELVVSRHFHHALESTSCPGLNVLRHLNFMNFLT